MEHPLHCNALKCRRELTDRALVTVCSHIFCLDCAQKIGLGHQDPTRRPACPACESRLSQPDDVRVHNLALSEACKSVVLSGLSPNVVMECAGRALSFWAYQTTQDLCYQQYLYKTLSDKYSEMRLSLQQTLIHAQSEIEDLRGQISNLSHERDALMRKRQDNHRSLKEQNRKLRHTQELYERVKMRAELGSMERAASDAVDSSLLALPQTSARGFPTTRMVYNTHDHANISTLSQCDRLQGEGSNADFPRSNLNTFRVDNRWSQAAYPRSMATGSLLDNNSRQRTGQVNAMGLPGVRGSSGSPGMGRRHAVNNTPSFASNREGLAGMGLTSGMKVSQPTHSAGLDAAVRTH